MLGILSKKQMAQEFFKNTSQNSDPNSAAHKSSWHCQSDLFSKKKQGNIFGHTVIASISIDNALCD